MQTVLKYYLADRFVLICKPISALCYSMLRHREIVHLKTCHNFDHFTKKEMQNTSRLNKMSWWKVKSYFSFFLAPFLTFTSGVGMAAISFYVVIVKTEQTIRGEATHAEKAPTLQRHLGEFIAEHLTFFKSENVITLRGIFDESVEAGKRHAYQINDLDGGCRRSRVLGWPHNCPLLTSCGRKRWWRMCRQTFAITTKVFVKRDFFLGWKQCFSNVTGTNKEYRKKIKRCHDFKKLIILELKYRLSSSWASLPLAVYTPKCTPNTTNAARTLKKSRHRWL